MSAILKSAHLPHLVHPLHSPPLAPPSNSQRTSCAVMQMPCAMVQFFFVLHFFIWTEHLTKTQLIFWIVRSLSTTPQLLQCTGQLRSGQDTRQDTGRTTRQDTGQEMWLRLALSLSHMGPLAPLGPTCSKNARIRSSEKRVFNMSCEEAKGVLPRKMRSMSLYIF